jgi:hypothetical protein
MGIGPYGRTILEGTLKTRISMNIDIPSDKGTHHASGMRKTRFCISIISSTVPMYERHQEFM